MNSEKLKELNYIFILFFFLKKYWSFMTLKINKIFETS